VVLIQAREEAMIFSRPLVSLRHLPSQAKATRPGSTWGSRHLEAVAGVGALDHLDRPFADAVYVLHCVKKTQKNGKSDLDMAAKRYADLVKELGP